MPVNPLIFLESKVSMRSIMRFVLRRAMLMEGEGMKVEQVELKCDYFWVESVRHERLHWIRVEPKQPGKVFDRRQARGQD
jgi:hypothetical protein